MVSFLRADFTLLFLSKLSSLRGKMPSKFSRPLILTLLGPLKLTKSSLAVGSYRKRISSSLPIPIRVPSEAEPTRVILGMSSRMRSVLMRNSRSTALMNFIRSCTIMQLILLFLSV